jgi:hypothetical protein
MNTFKSTLLAAALVAAALPLGANAESQFSTGIASPITANARLDFQINIPKILLLNVGSTGATVDLIEFDVTAAQLQSGGAVNATAASGDLGNGTVTARVLGNNGQVTLTATATGPLTNATGDTISYSEIVTTSSAPGTLPAPVLADGVSAPVNVPVTAGKITDASAQWTYTYANSTQVAPGTYGGVNTNNGRVTYTASMP